MPAAVYSGPIEHVVVVMLDRRSYDDVLGLLYDGANEAPYAGAPPGQRELDGTGAGGLRPHDVPVTAYLARQFMVCDRWFASSTSRGAANQLFANCAAEGNGNGAVVLEPNVFSALDATRGGAGEIQNWKVYFHDDALIGRALSYVARCFDDPDNANVANYDECDYPPGARNPLARPATTFLQDVAQGRLPAYSFIEPRHGRRRMPVSVATGESAARSGNGATSDPFDDEALLCEVYLALRTSRYWEHSLLLVVYGAPGTVIDHVAPPHAFGGRVPAIVVSPYAEPGSRLRAIVPFEHASIVKTLWQCFDLRRLGQASINQRDEAAPSLLDYLAPRVVNHPAPGVEIGQLGVSALAR